MSWHEPPIYLMERKMSISPRICSCALSFPLVCSSARLSSSATRRTSISAWPTSRCSRCVLVPAHNRRACASAHVSPPSHPQGGVIMDVVNAEQVRDLPLHVSKRNTHRMRRDLLSDRRGSQKRPGCVLIWFSRRSFMDISYVFQACAVMALERVPADIRAAGGVARMVSSDDLATPDR